MSNRSMIMPKELEKKLKREAAEKGLAGEPYQRYVYGTMRKTGWTPSKREGSSKKRRRRK